MIARIIYSTMAAALVLGGATSFAGAQGPQTAILNVFPTGQQTGAQTQIDFSGPSSCQVLQSRMSVTFTTAGTFDAADLVIGLVAPLGPSPGSGGWYVTGADLGWSGSGLFTASVSSDFLNGIAISSTWTLRVGSLNDPPTYSGEFSADSRVEIDYIQLPPPCAADFNHDGVALVNDITSFIGVWFTESGLSGPGLRTDANGDGLVTVPDIFAFLGLWTRGC